jgi:hypothetical protein
MKGRFMQSLRVFLLPLSCLVATLSVSCTSLNFAPVGTSDRFVIEYEDNGYLEHALVDAVRDEQLRAQAITAHEYALPIVALERWHAGFLQEANHGDWLIYEERDQKIPILTANTTTPYVLTFLDLSEGSFYLDLPAGPIGGMIIDIYQTPQADLGVVGPDQGKGGRYLVVGPDSVVPEAHDADFVVQSSSNLVFIGSRIIGLEGDRREAREPEVHRRCLIAGLDGGSVAGHRILAGPESGSAERTGRRSQSIHPDAATAPRYGEGAALRAR